MNKLLLLGIVILGIKSVFSASIKDIFFNLDIRKIEENISKVKKNLNLLDTPKTNEKFDIKRDPFIPILEKLKKETEIKKEKKEKIEKEEPEPVLPEFILSGIIYDEKKPLVIINGSVLEEKQYLGECQIYKIFTNKVIIRYRNKFIVLNLYKTED